MGFGIRLKSFELVLSATRRVHWRTPGRRRALHQRTAHWSGHSQPFQVGTRQEGSVWVCLRSPQDASHLCVGSVILLLQDQSLLLCKATHVVNVYKTLTFRFHIYSILDILRGEARVLEGLHNLGIKGEHQGKLLRLPVNAVDDSYALDIRHPAIMVSLVQKHGSSGPDAGVCFSLCTRVCTKCISHQTSNSLEPASNFRY